MCPCLKNVPIYYLSEICPKMFSLKYVHLKCVCLKSVRLKNVAVPKCCYRCSSSSNRPQGQDCGGGDCRQHDGRVRWNHLRHPARAGWLQSSGIQPWSHRATLCWTIQCKYQLLPLFIGHFFTLATPCTKDLFWPVAKLARRDETRHWQGFFCGSA